MANTAVKMAAVAQQLERRIYIVRGQKVMLDLNEQVRRNLGRFPKDFMFPLTKTETANLKSQIAASSWGGSRKAPLAFTEHGVAMLSAVLYSQRAMRMSILVIRAFVKLREVLAKDKEFAFRLERVETVQDLHGNVLERLADDIEKIKVFPERPKRKVGFQPAG